MYGDADAMKSFVGRLGVTIGLNQQLADGGMFQPYLKLAVAHEFAENNVVHVNGERFDNDLSGLRGEVGLGVAAQVSQNLHLHGDFDYVNGKNIEQKWGVNLGLRYKY